MRRWRHLHRDYRVVTRRWLVEVRVVSLHARIVVAKSADEAKRIADAKGWNDDTFNMIDAVEPYGDPIEEEDEEE